MTRLLVFYCVGPSRAGSARGVVGGEPRAVVFARSRKTVVALNRATRAAAMERSQRVDGVVAPVTLEKEAPVTHGVGDLAFVPEPEAAPDVAVDVEDVMREGAGDGLRMLVRVEDLQ